MFFKQQASKNDAVNDMAHESNAAGDSGGLGLSRIADDWIIFLTTCRRHD